MRWTIWILVTLLVSTSASAASPNTEHYQGTARSPSGELLYRERHTVVKLDDRPLTATTSYFDASGRQIGELKSDFSQSPYAPTYEFVDRRSGITEKVAVSASGVTLEYQGNKKLLPVKSDLPLVIGQGMHHYVRLNLHRLARKETTVRFAIPSRLDTYTFRIRPLPSPAPNVIRLRIEVDNVLLRLLAPYLEVDYDMTTKRLLRYEGVSNLEDKDGDTQKAIIKYQYGDAS